MAFCPNCGNQTTGAFCPNCGAPVPASAGAGSAAPPPSPPPQDPGAGPQYQPSQSLNAPGLSENVAGALCYLGSFVTGVIFLILAPYNQSKFVRFHAFQSIFLFVAYIACAIVFAILGHLGLLLNALLVPAFIVVWLYMMYSAFNNKKVKIPLIGDLAEKQS